MYLLVTCDHMYFKFYYNPINKSYTAWPSLKTCPLCQYHLPTGLEATGGPLGPAQPLKSSKIGHQTPSEVNLHFL